MQAIDIKGIILGTPLAFLGLFMLDSSKELVSRSGDIR